MPLVGLSIGRTAWYTPASQRGDSRPTEFRLRLPTADHYAEFEDALLAVISGERRITPNRAYNRALELDLIGWRNFTWQDPETGTVVPAEFLGSEAGAMPADVSKIPPGIRAELFRELRRMGEVPPQLFPGSDSLAASPSSRSTSIVGDVAAGSATRRESCGGQDQTEG